MIKYINILFSLLLSSMIINTFVFANDLDQVRTALKKELNICYFSLNNELEFFTTQNFVKKINISKTYDINVHEFQIEKSSPKESFKAMLNSGIRCDGLVISGHHTGAFGGKRATGTLEIDFLEELSCNETYYQWFSQIKALWLQGCRTLGAKIESNTDADSNALRVYNAREADHLQQDRGQMAMEFSATFDQENPLSTRYLRIFPNATTFGWTRTAPGENWESEKSIVYHIANILKLHTKDNIEINPFEELDEKQKSAYSDQLIQLLSRNDLCDDEKALCYENEEEYYKQAWINHGDRENFTYAYFNKDLIAYPSLNSSNIEVKANLHQARINSCNLMDTEKENHKLIIETTKNILSSIEMIGLNFNRLFETFTEFESFHAYNLLPIFHTLFKDNENLLDFLQLKFKSKSLSLSRKMDYFNFYRKITGKKHEDIIKTLKEKILKVLALPKANRQGLTQEETYSADDSDQALSEYKSSTIESMTRNKIYSSISELKILMRHPTIPVTGIVYILQALQNYEIGEIPDIEKELEFLWFYKGRTLALSQEILNFIAIYEYPIRGIDLYIKRYIDTYHLEEEGKPYIKYLIEIISKSIIPIDHAPIKELLIYYNEEQNFDVTMLYSFMVAIDNYNGRLGDGIDAPALLKRLKTKFPENADSLYYYYHLNTLYTLLDDKQTWHSYELEQLFKTLNIYIKRNEEESYFLTAIRIGACFISDIDEYKILKSYALKSKIKDPVARLIKSLAYCPKINKDIVVILESEIDSSTDNIALIVELVESIGVVKNLLSSSLFFRRYIQEAS